MRHRKWWTLLAVCVATFMLLLDVTIVNVALPDIQRSLRASFSDLQWVVDAYSLTLAALLLTAGSLADLMGRKRVFILGLAVFTAASLLCALASTPTWLNLARGVQGIGGAMMFATSLALLAQEFTGRQRGTAFGIWGAVTGGAVAVGPLIGGALTEAQGWEWIFLVNVPVGLGAIALAQAKLAQPPESPRGRVDWLGLVSFSGALFCLVLGLIRGNDLGWSSAQIVSLLIGSGLLLVIFVLVERRVSDPMLDLSLFRKPAFVGASIAAFALSAAMFSMFLFLTLYLQSILGYGPLDAGLRFLPNTLLAFAVAPLAGRLSTHLPVRALLGGGLVLVGLGLVLMHGLTASSGWTALLPGFIVAGAGIGMVNPPLASTAIGVVPPARSGMASGINTTFRQVGIATGIAVLGAIFQHAVITKVAQLTPGLGSALPSRDFARAVYSGASAQVIAAAPAPLRPALERVAHASFTSALNELFLVGATVALIAAVLSFALVRRRDFAAGTAQAQTQAATA